ncbi:MAG: TVP38/TMEM64 family protein [Alphaproteobacteria bacterium]
MNKKIIKIGLLLLFGLAIALFFALDLQQYATLDYIKSQQDALRDYYAQNTLLMFVIFGLIYVAVTALSLPIAAVLTLAAGALFGLGAGLVMVSFASTIGASLAFLMARFLARDYVQQKYSKQLSKINQGFEREGAFYLFALRLVPIFPFFMVNVVTALMPVKLRVFYWVSQLGMLPGTAIYVYAGTQLAQIESLRDITSPPLLAAFILLGLFPLISKKLVQWLRRKKI